MKNYQTPCLIAGNNFVLDQQRIPEMNKMDVYSIQTKNWELNISSGLILHMKIFKTKEITATHVETVEQNLLL